MAACHRPGGAWGCRVEGVGRSECARAVGGALLLGVVLVGVQPSCSHCMACTVRPPAQRRLQGCAVRGGLQGRGCRVGACTGSAACGSTPQHAKRLGASSIAPASTPAAEEPRLKGSASKLTRSHGAGHTTAVPMASPPSPSLGKPAGGCLQGCSVRPASQLSRSSASVAKAHSPPCGDVGGGGGGGAGGQPGWVAHAQQATQLA